VAAALVLAAIALGVFLLRPARALSVAGELAAAPDVEAEPAYLEEAA
jgi:hypothetical protein